MDPKIKKLTSRVKKKQCEMGLLKSTNEDFGVIE
jgi:hypothetical protein